MLKIFDEEVIPFREECGCGCHCSCTGAVLIATCGTSFVFTTGTTYDAALLIQQEM